MPGQSTSMTKYGPSRDDIEKEVAPLAQELPAEIKDEIIPQEII